jgi:glycosyltransferase involved in cell wall biosynthesis
MKNTVSQNVFINGRFLSQPLTGVQRYALETLLSIDSQIGEPMADSNIRWSLLVPRGIDRLPVLKNIEIKETGILSGHAWEQIELPFYTRGGLLFSFGLTGPVLHRRQIITLHDANVYRMPETYSWKFRLWYKFVIRRLVRESVIRIVAVSRFAAKEAQVYYGADPEILRVVTEGWQHLDKLDPDESVLDRYALRGQPFSLAVSSLTPNKNFNAIARAIALLDEQVPVCVVAGRVDAGIFRGVNLEGGAKVIPLGYVSDAELKALYLNATCFIFPSFYEGFGIPPLEAMACGCPVVASTAEAVREVCGDAPLYFNPGEPAELADCLRTVFHDKELRRRMSTDGLERARGYSWVDAARLNIECIREALCAA